MEIYRGVDADPDFTASPWKPSLLCLIRLLRSLRAYVQFCHRLRTSSPAEQNISKSTLVFSAGGLAVNIRARLLVLAKGPSGELFVASYDYNADAAAVAG